MGLGDQLMGSGMARGANARGKRIAFGDGTRIIWDQHSDTIFRGNPNIAKPGSERDKDIEWRPFYKGHRLYNQQDVTRNRWVWNYEFKATPGEVFLERSELRNGARAGRGFVVIEPNAPAWKSVAPNKDWGFSNYQALTDRLIGEGLEVVQFTYPKGGPILIGARAVRTTGFRDGLAILAHARLFIGPEGGMHHGAAAMQRQAVVLFGGFIPPAVTGYDGHANLTGGAEACGSLAPCAHCKAAMAAISVDEVFEAAMERL